VSHRIAQQVSDRLRDAVQHHPVELRLSPSDREVDVDAAGRSEIPDSSRERPGDRAQGHGPHLQDGLLQRIEQRLTSSERFFDALISGSSRGTGAEEMLESPALEDGFPDGVEQAVNLGRRGADQATFDRSDRRRRAVRHRTFGR
jgi:hypothetical protein